MKTLFISLTLFLCSQFLFAQVSKTVYLANAGTLSAELTTEELNTITDLTITGTIDATDFVIMRDSMPLLAEIDLSSVTIAEYTGTEGTAGTGNITYPVNAIPERAFCSIDNVGKNSLISVDLPKSIKKIQSYAFLNCSKISSVLIPSQVTAIGRSAFNRCTSINAVTFEINSSLETIDTMAFRGIPTLTKIEIPSTVVTIKYGAFYDCSGLETINFDSSPKLLAIEDYAFRGCTNLILIDNLPFLKQIGNYVFYRCSKLSFFDSPVIERVGNYAFYGCSGLKIFGNTPLLNYIGDRAFQNCSELDSLSIPLSTSYIGFYAFIGSNISISVDSENQIYSSEDGVLFNKTKQELIYCPKLKAGSYYLPSTVAWISNAAFYTCTALDSIILPLSLITIDDWAFEDCTGLTAIKIPASVQRIGSYAFSGCTGLSKISTNAIFPVNLSSSTSVFNIVNKTTCTLYVPFGTKASYQTANQWQDFLNIFEMPGFSLSATTATLEATQGSFTTVRISSDVTWTATSDQSWLSVDPATGFGNEQTVTIIASEANPNSTSRVTTVTVSANGVESQTISVVQAYPFEILITKIFDFESSISGKLPIASLLETDDYIFGSTSQGGTHDLGTIFKIKNDGTGYTKLFDFKGSDTGKNPIGQLTLIGDALYGTTVGDDYFGTANDTIDYGNIFKINTDGSGFMKLHEFDETNGKDPNGSLVLYNGSLYGITNDGGNESHGVIFKINPDGTGFTKVSDNSDFDTGENPYNGIIISNDVIYGVSTVDFGGVFSVNTDGTGLKKLFEMNKESGDFSYCKPLLVNDELYITTSEGGENGVGTIFKIRTDGTGFKVLYNFEGIDEDVQSSGFRNNSLIYNNGILYGTASGNGINDNGYLFKINLDGTEFLKLSDFSGDYGSLPFMCDLIIDKHKTIYGMTSLGGKYNEGIIYKFPLNDIPVANSGTDQTVYEGETVILDGSSSSDQDNDKLNYLWIYPEGITMSSDTAKRPVFTAPDVLTDTDFVFSLVVNDGIVNSEPDTVKITVLNSSNCPQHYHPVWEGTLGFDHMNINVIGARYDGMDLESGDEIGVFDGDICVGYGKVTGPIGLQNILSIKVSRDDGTGNGFTSGNEVTYRIWDCSDSSEYTVQEVTCYDIELNPITCSPFEAGGTSFVELSGKGEECFTLEFRTGWNLFSVPVLMDSTNMMYVFQPMIDSKSLVKIQDELGNSLENWGIFGGWQNNIGEIGLTEGYKIKVNWLDSINVCGQHVKYPYAIALQTGWNIIGYPQSRVYDAQEVVQQLIDRNTLVKVQDELGNSLENWGIFGGWQNHIGNLLPGEGYKVKVIAQDTLWIYESYTKSGAIQPELVASTHFRQNYAGNGVDHMNINLVGLPINVLQAGDEFAVFEGEACVGAVTLTQHNINNQAVQLTASAFDGQAAGGFTEGSRFTLKLWSLATGAEYTITPEIHSGSATFAKHETTVASLEKYTITGFDEIAGLEGTTVRCYPNPFSESVTIEINLSTEAEVEVEVLNQLGQVVSELIPNQRRAAGLHQLVWNGRNTQGQQVTPGMYHLRVSMNESVLHRKVIFSK